MHLRRLRLVSFRAHAESTLAFAPKVNLLTGPNGAGKTNVLEAVHYLCLSKSFLTSSDAYVLQRDRPFFEAEGDFESERRPSLQVRLVYVPDEGKKLFVNRAPLDRLSHIVGQLPVVVIAPDDYDLTAGGPEQRRRFLDNTLSQSKPVYLDDLLKYRRALKQRNALLLHLKRNRGASDAGLDAWTEELVTLGARIVVRRARFLARFAGFLAEAYAQLGEVGEEPTFDYQTFAPLPDGPDDAPAHDPAAASLDTEAIADLFRQHLGRRARQERERGRTLLGPHRDEIVFRLNGFEVRPYASQGQHRTFGLALKLAKFFYLKDRLDETPLLLLDDVFGTLDVKRARVVLALLRSDAVGQSLLTAARADAFADLIDFDGATHRHLRVEGGRVLTLSVDNAAPLPIRPADAAVSDDSIETTPASS
ncbi:MAG: DNA replication and repair protein RecF [Bacteroidota bacterium]